MAFETVWNINPGADFAETVVARDQAGAALNLTGFTATIEDVSGVLGSAVAISIPNAALGQLRFTLTWQASWPLIRTTLGAFRVLLANGTDESTPFLVYVRVAASNARVTVPRGADMAWGFTWPDDSEGVDLTGQTIEVINASATLAPLMTVVVLNAATRACEVRLEGDLATPVGNAGSFQLRRSTAGANRRTLPPIAVIIA